MRLRGLVRKEFLQIFRDPSSIAIAFLMPVVLLLLFGYGVSLDAEPRTRGAGGRTAQRRHRQLHRAFHKSRYFVPTAFRHHAARPKPP